jgi:hypothetical protein
MGILCLPCQPPPPNPPLRLPGPGPGLCDDLDLDCPILSYKAMKFYLLSSVDVLNLLATRTGLVLQTHINFPRFLPIFPDFLERLSHLAPIY